MNVAFSRAKEHMALVSSIRYTDVKNDYNDGARCLKNCLHYADACSVGDEAVARRVLSELVLWREEERQQSEQRSNPVVTQLAEALEQRGYRVERDLGQSQFRCDLAVCRDSDSEYRLGIFVDHGEYYRQSDILERDVLRPQLLRTFGWHVHHVLTKDWLEHRNRVLDRIEKILRGEEETVDEEPAEEVEIDEVPDSVPEPRPEPPPLDAPADKDWTRYFEFIGGSSQKFWEITLSGSQYSVRFGRIGTEGQERTKSFANPAVAEEQARGIIREKLAKGYVEKTR